MAVLFTYPLKSTLSPNDLALISNSEDGNKTNNATMASIKDVIDVVDSVVAGSGISVSSNTGNITIGNTGVLALQAGTNISLSGSTGAITVSSLSVGGSGTGGRITKWATNGSDIENSIITEYSNAISISGNLSISGGYISTPSILDSSLQQGAANQVLSAGPNGGSIEWVDQFNPGGLEYSGTWNAFNNTPALASGVGTTGDFYIVSTPGSTNLDGITDWKVGDWAIFVESGATDTWQKVDNSSVLNGSGTGQKIPVWLGSGPSVTLTDSMMTTIPQAGQFTDKFMSFDGGISTQQLELNRGLIDGAGSQGVDGYVLSSTTVDGNKEVAWINSPSSYVLPAATQFNLGGVKTGYVPPSSSPRNYALSIDSQGNAFANVPWTDNNTTDITLTTTGNTGPATWNGTTLNIPEYTTNAGAVLSITATRGNYQGVEYVSISNLSNAVGNVNLGLVGLTATNFGGTPPNPGTTDCRLLIKDNYWANLWPAQQNFIGGIALSSATVQTVAPNAVSSTASKTYSVQLDANNNAVVNVPWTGGSGSALNVGNQGTYFSVDTGKLNFSNGNHSLLTASSSNNGSEVSVTTIPLTGFSPAPLYQVTENLAIEQTSIGMYVTDNNIKVNKVKFMGTNLIAPEPPKPVCYIAIYPVDTSLNSSTVPVQTPSAIFQLDPSSENPSGGIPANQVGIRTATLIYEKDGLNYLQYPVGRDIAISTTTKNFAIGGVPCQPDANYTKASAAFVGDYGLSENLFSLASLLEEMGTGDAATLLPALQFFYEEAFTPVVD